MGARTCGLHAIVVVCLLVYVCGKCDLIDVYSSTELHSEGIVLTYEMYNSSAATM